MYFLRCCSICANEREIEWRLKIQQKIDSERKKSLKKCHRNLFLLLIKERYDEKLNYLKFLQHSITNIPLYLYHLLCAINQYQSGYNKRLVSFHLFIIEKKKLNQY